MTNTSFDLSGKIDNPTIDALLELKTVADRLYVPFFMVGASARDFILKFHYGLQTRRMTKDIDLAVEVASWDSFRQLTESLVGTGKFRASTERQRFYHGSVIIDIVPFGPISDINEKISWPPEHQVIMSVVGFKEAYEWSMRVRLSSNPDLQIRLATLSGLALLKVISWDERYPERKKDAEDLLLIMDEFEKTINLDRLYIDEWAVLEDEGFDTQLASIRLLGREMARMAKPETAESILRILDAETADHSKFRLVMDMMGSNDLIADRFEKNLSKLQRLMTGLRKS